jgi:hypothetical protein
MDKETYYGVSEYADTSTASLGDITFDVTEGSLSPFTLDTNSSFISGGTSVNTITLDNITYDFAVVCDTTNNTPARINANEFYIDVAVEPTKAAEFKDVLPTVNKVEDMCNEYPALAKAYENFKTIYKMVDQDYLGKQKEIN